MSVKIGQASINENGRISGGETGDQTGYEIRVCAWYDFPWDTYLECIDPEMAEQAAQAMENYCNDDSHGYDQAERWGPNYDCSSSTLQSYRDAGLPIAATGYTGNMETILLGTGKFKSYKDAAHVNSSDYAKRGGIYLNTTHHVVMALSDGPCAGRESTEQTDTATDSGGYTLEQFVRDVQSCTGSAVDGEAGPETIGNTPTLSQTINSTHAAVKPVQKRLISLGYSCSPDGTDGADGELGPNTTAAIIAYQQDNDCEADGEITAKCRTWRKLLGMI